MKKISKDIFTPYCYEADSIRPMLEKPFPCGDYVAATDTHVLLMIRKDLLENSYPEVRATPNVMKVTPKVNCDLPLTQEQIATALGALPHEEEMYEAAPAVQCPECDGDGEVEWVYEDKDYYRHTDWFNCPCCKGSGLLRKAVMKPTGKITVDISACIIINGVGFRAHVLETLLDTMKSLDIKEVNIISLNKSRPCMIRIADGITFIFMPLTDMSYSKDVYHLNIF